MASPEQELPASHLPIGKALDTLRSLGMSTLGAEELQNYVLSIESDAGRLQALRALGELGLAKTDFGMPKQLLRDYQSPFDQFLTHLLPEDEARQQFATLNSTQRGALALHLAKVFSLSPLQAERLHAMAATSNYIEAEGATGATRQQLSSTKNKILQRVQTFCDDDKTLLPQALQQFIAENHVRFPEDAIPAPVLIRRELQRLLRVSAPQTGSRMRAMYSHLIGEAGVSVEIIKRPASLLRKSMEQYQRLQGGKTSGGSSRDSSNEDMQVLSMLLGKPANGDAPGSYMQVIRAFIKRGKLVTFEQARTMTARALERLPRLKI